MTAVFSISIAAAHRIGLTAVHSRAAENANMAAIAEAYQQKHTTSHEGTQKIAVTSLSVTSSMVTNWTHA